MAQSNISSSVLDTKAKTGSIDQRDSTSVATIDQPSQCHNLHTYILNVLLWNQKFHFMVKCSKFQHVFKNKLFKLFKSHNKLQFGIRICSIYVSKQKLHISTTLYVYNKNYSKEIHPGVMIPVTLLQSTGPPPIPLCL